MILIFWKRWGALALLYPVLGLVLWLVIGGAIRAASGAVGTQGTWNLAGVAIGFAIASLAGWFFSVHVIERRLDRRPDADGRTERSTLLFIPVRYWAFVTAGFGLLLLTLNAIDVASLG